MVHAKYFLGSHIFPCVTDRYWMILDSRHDKYFHIDRREFERLGPWLYGWEGTLQEGGTDEPAEIPEDAKRLAETLVAHGILSTASEGTKAIRGPSVSPASEELHAHEERASLTALLRHGPSVLYACHVANSQLGRQSLQDTLRSAAQRNGRRFEQSFSFRRAKELVGIFNSLRYFYPRDYLCLFDSLALLYFLNSKGLFPQWVFGVTCDPFSAHCWLQAENVVLNDTVAQVSEFTAIMSI